MVSSSDICLGKYSDKTLTFGLQALENDKLSDFGYKSNKIGSLIGTNFEYLEDFGRSERSRRGCLGRTWKTNVWRVNTPPPSINTMRFKNKKRRVGRPKGSKNKKSGKKKVVKTVKTVVTTTTTTIINQ